MPFINRSIVALLFAAFSMGPSISSAQSANATGYPPEPTDEVPQIAEVVGNAFGTPPEPNEILESPAAPEEVVEPTIVLREYQVIPSVGRYGRVPFHQDAIESQLVRGEFNPPKSGDSVRLPDGKSQIWRSVRAGDDGWLIDKSLRGGYAFATIESSEDRMMLLHARGHSTVYVGDAPRTGDPYNFGFVRLPIRLRKGQNQFLFHVGTGRVRAELIPPEKLALLDMADATLPDLIAGETKPKWAAVVVINATEEPLDGMAIVCTRTGNRPVTSPIATIPPLSIYKAPFQLNGAAPVGEKKVAYALQLVTANQLRTIDSQTGDSASAEGLLHEVTFTLPVIEPSDPHKRTFVSEIDGSVQHYAVRPGLPRDQGRHGILLTLHGAGVEAEKQAALYSAKEWAHVVAPTNRRTYGFDWEDWGRRDALEALADAARQYDTDPNRVFLTGHSMGGHGTWHLGTTYPDRFAAIGPSAGWVSFWSYGGMPKIENPTPMEKMLLRGSMPSDPAVLAANLGALGVFVLHGQQDDNVPVAQSRFMRAQLGTFHSNFVYHEQPGAKHWWGSQCCDWPPMMQFLRNHRLPPAADVRRVRFLTASPGVASEMYWIAIESQVRPLLPSRVVIECDPKRRLFSGTTDNVSRMAIDVEHLSPGPIAIQMDGQKRLVVRWPGKERKVWIARREGTWRPARRPPARLKGPHRYGSFKDVFRHRAVLVYGTKGSAEENAWSRAKSRFDAETFWYRGNGALEVIPDTAFDPKTLKDRNVVLYGNAATNAAWPALLSTSEIRIRDDISIGDRRELSADLACLFIVPRQDSDVASVGVVSGTSLNGMRLTNRLRYFVSGVAYPDLAIFDAGVLSEGAPAIRALGYFGEDWKIESGDFEWRDVAL